MLKVVEKEASLKVFYYLMAVDNEVSSEELEVLNQIAKDVLGEGYFEKMQAVVYECQGRLDAVSADEERYDVLSEEVDRAMAPSAPSIEEGMVPRLLLWNMLTIAYADGSYSKEEKRLISHVARVLKIEKDVVLEMNQLIDTAVAVDKQLKSLSDSDLPYREIRPLAEEAEKRKQTIMEEAKALIADDIVLDTAVKEEQKEDFFQAAGKKISDTVAPVAKNIGDKTAEGLKTAADAVSVRAAQGAQDFLTGVGRLFGKFGDSSKKNKED